MFAKKTLKYPLFLFIMILIAKVVYILVESGYNYDVFVLTTSSEFTRESIEALNSRGHTIASIGFTLLLMPCLYFLSKKRSTIKKMAISLSILSLISFSLFYISLNFFVEHIVEENRDKRYEAYYTNLIKYGMLNNILTYNAFIPLERMNHLKLSDKILLTNIFLLTDEDRELIAKFREKGEKNTIKLFAKKYKERDDFRTHVDEEKIREAFNRLNSELQTKYLNYKKAYEELDSKASKEITLNRLSEIKTKLDKYFKYQQYQKAKDRYKEEMIANFGHYIEPNSWLGSSGFVSLSSISKNIKNEMRLEIKEEALGLDEGLNKEEFLQTIEVKREVAKRLKKEGILIPIEFDYSYKDFRKYYLVMFEKKYREVGGEFEQMVTDKIIYEKDEFYNNKEVAQKGDEAIKLLYIPPIALGLSLLALILNFFTVIDMILELSGAKKGFRFRIYSIMVLFIILMPILSSDESIESKILEKRENSYILSFLEWSSYWIKVNYSIQRLGAKHE